MKLEGPKSWRSLLLDLLGSVQAGILRDDPMGENADRARDLLVKYLKKHATRIAKDA